MSGRLAFAFAAVGLATAVAAHAQPGGGAAPASPAPAAPSGAAAGEASAAPERRLVTIRFVGHNVADHWAALLQKALDRSWREGSPPPPHLVRETALGARTSLCEVYVQELGLPGCSNDVQRLAVRLNPRPLEAGGTVLVPRLALEETRWGRTFDTEDAKQRQELEDLRKRWEKQVQFEQYRQGEVVREWLPAYRIRLELPAPAADALEDAFYDADIPFANFSRADEAPELYAYVPPNQHVGACRNAPGAPAGAKGAYSLMIGGPPAQGRCTGSECPVVFLVDTRLHAHPALVPALLTPGAPADGADPAAPEGQCPIVAFDPAEHHGTHMAGIIAGRDVAGSHFVGLAQDASLYGIVWKGDVDVVPDTIERLREQEPAILDRPQIWVFASRFPYNARDLREGSLLDTLVRLRAPSAARAIVDQRMLWITAIGQPMEEVDPPRTVERTTPLSPMNLGDQPNVVVVSACDVCSGRGRRLWGRANEASSELVHVAAPGGNPVPGIATASQYGEAAGTSSAVAFVGGLAAAMTAAFPNYYGNGPEFTKLRLQLTADPILPRAGQQVATGIIDGALALCDPRVDWLEHASELPPAAEACAGGHRRVARVEWCTDLLDLPELDEDGEEQQTDPLRTAGIRRIVRVEPEEDRDRWIVYKHDPKHRDDRDNLTKARVTKHGPFVRGADAPPLLRVEYADGAKRVLAIDDVKDLLLRGGASLATDRCGS